MIVPRHPNLLRQPLEADCVFHHAASAQRTYSRAVNLLPGSLVFRETVTSRRLKRRSTRREFRVLKQYIDLTAPQIDAYSITRPQQGQPATSGRLRCRVQYGR